MAIRIRQPRLDDAEPLLQAARESVEQLFPWMPWARSEYTLDDSCAWIAHCEATWAQGVEYNFAIVDQADRYLGGCGLNQLNREHYIANLGYWVRTSARGGASRRRPSGPWPTSPSGKRTWPAWRS